MIAPHNPPTISASRRDRPARAAPRPLPACYVVTHRQRRRCSTELHRFRTASVLPARVVVNVGRNSRAEMLMPARFASTCFFPLPHAFGIEQCRTDKHEEESQRPEQTTERPRCGYRDQSGDDQAKAQGFSDAHGSLTNHITSPLSGRGASNASPRSAEAQSSMPSARSTPRSLATSFDHLVGPHHQRLWNREPQCPRGLRVDDQLVLRGLLDG